MTGQGIDRTVQAAFDANGRNNAEITGVTKG